VDVNIGAPRPNSDWFDAVRLLASPQYRAAFAPRVLSTSLACTWVAAGGGRATSPTAS
jgi:myo-inositol-1(or 4)-monophosphatase